MALLVATFAAEATRAASTNSTPVVSGDGNISQYDIAPHGGLSPPAAAVRLLLAVEQPGLARRPISLYSTESAALMDPVEPILVTRIFEDSLG